MTNVDKCFSSFVYISLCNNNIFTRYLLSLCKTTGHRRRRLRIIFTWLLLRNFFDSIMEWSIGESLLSAQLYKYMVILFAYEVVYLYPSSYYTKFLFQNMSWYFVRVSNLFSFNDESLKIKFLGQNNQRN